MWKLELGTCAKQAQENLPTLWVSSCHMGVWDEHFHGEPLVWSGGMRKLARVMSSLRPVCLDQKTISLFVLCHCLRYNLGWGICWHVLHSCGVPFVREEKNGWHTQSFEPQKSFKLIGCMCLHFWEAGLAEVRWGFFALTFLCLVQLQTLVQCLAIRTLYSHFCCWLRRLQTCSIGPPDFTFT